MRDGVVQQFGTPDDIYSRPATRFVAEFIGSPAMNMLVVDAIGAALSVKDTAIALTADQQRALKNQPAERLVIGLRPECVYLGEQGVAGRLTLLEPTGPDTYAFVDTAMGNMVLRVAGNVAQRIGDPVRLAWEARDLHLFNAQTGARIG